MDIRKLRIIEAYHLSGGRLGQIKGIGELSPNQLEKIYLSTNKRELEREDLASLKTAWTSITSSTPDNLGKYLDKNENRFAYINKGLHHFITRYPAKNTGLNYYDAALLRYSIEQGPISARVIGFTMAEWDWHLDMMGDLHLFWQMKMLGDEQLKYPALHLTGDKKQLRGTEVTITEMGRKFLNGEENFAKLNRIDYWVGGVHLTPENGIWCYEKGQIVPL